MRALAKHKPDTDGREDPEEKMGMAWPKKTHYRSIMRQALIDRYLYRANNQPKASQSPFTFTLPYFITVPSSGTKSKFKKHNDCLNIFVSGLSFQ